MPVPDGSLSAAEWGSVRWSAVAEGGFESRGRSPSEKGFPPFLKRDVIDSDAMPAPLRQALARVQADFEVATDLECSWWFYQDPEPGSDDAEPNAGGVVMCMIATESGHGFSLDLDSDEEEAAVRMADEGTEQVFETLGETVSWEVAERWPPCPRPGHEDHGIAPDLRRGRAVWIWREGVVAEIGRLGDWYVSPSE